MLKTLIVDDEKLVRKGIIGLGDWSRYDVDIVGEAENGRAAVEFLENNAVDLMITDLSMPGLGGIPFLRTVRECFPKVRIIVLTMHQEFEILQQAMRLGIIDYITKAQLEQESFDEIMGNVVKRLRHSFLSAADKNSVKAISNYAHVLYTPVAIPQAEYLNMEKTGFFLLSDNLWVSYEENLGIPGFASEYSTLMKVEHFENLTSHQFIALLQHYIHHVLFYHYNPDAKLYGVDIEQFQAIQPQISPVAKDEAAIQMQDEKWLKDDEWYIMCINNIKLLNMTRDELLVFCYQAYLSWSRYRTQDIGTYFEQTEQFFWWYQWKEWLASQREELAGIISANDHSGKQYIINALTYIQAHYTQDISLQQMLQISGMSKSYFSQCFKKVTGTTLVNYIKNLRIEQAKTLLVTSSQPVSWVGEQVGYLDERYFRRVFAECTGIPPSEYRKISKPIREL